MLVVALIAFLIFRYVGDPIVSMAGVDTRLEIRTDAPAAGANDPFYVSSGTS